MKARISGCIDKMLGEEIIWPSKEKLEQNWIKPHHLNNFDIQKYCQNEPKFNGVLFQEIIYLK